MEGPTSSNRQHRRDIRFRRTRAALAGVAMGAAAITPLVITAEPAAAAVSGCSKGLNTATKAWGTCTSGSGWWSLTAQCYGWGANTVWKYGTGTAYTTCPSWSHVTNVILNVQY